MLCWCFGSVCGARDACGMLHPVLPGAVCTGTDVHVLWTLKGRKRSAQQLNNMVMGLYAHWEVSDEVAFDDFLLRGGCEPVDYRKRACALPLPAACLLPLRV